MIADVWSFGVMCYEVMTHGKMPYSDWEHNNVFFNVLKGAKMNRLDEDRDCIDDSVWAFMNSLWNDNPSYRSGFSDIKKQLEKLVEAKMDETYQQPYEKPTMHYPEEDGYARAYRPSV